MSDIHFQSKRRKTKAQLDAEKSRKAEEKQSLEQRLAEVEEMQREIAGLRALNENNQGAHDQLVGLIRRGHVVRNGDGSCSVPVAEQQEQMNANGLNQ